MIIRIGSHRAWDKVERVLGYRPHGLYNMEYPGSYGLCDVTEDEFSKINHIKMVKKSRVKKEELYRCWRNMA